MTLHRRSTGRARQLRRRSTPEEISLWKDLRGGRFEGYKFRRQHPIGKYYVDFFCHEKKLVIELDGGGHGDPVQESRDRDRTAFLEERGNRVLRFWNHEVAESRDAVLGRIFRVLEGDEEDS